MNIAVIALTKNGIAKGLQLHDLAALDVFAKANALLDRQSLSSRATVFDGSLSELLREIYHRYDGFIFIMATGIVIRSMLPYIKDKATDKPVIVIDELGQFVISLLAGHIGGANKLARYIAKLIGATPVITTATDLNSVIAFDVVAVENNLIIENIESMKDISGELVNGGIVAVQSDLELFGRLPNNIVIHNGISQKLVVISNKLQHDVGQVATLVLRPKNLVLGVGCKRNTDKAKLETTIISFMALKGYSMKALYRIASIDLKCDEMAILNFADKYKLCTKFYSKDELSQVSDQFIQSDFVASVTGVGNVCDSAGYLGSDCGRQLVSKESYDGITLSLYEVDRKVSLGGINE